MVELGGVWWQKNGSEDFNMSASQRTLVKGGGGGGEVSTKCHTKDVFVLFCFVFVKYKFQNILIYVNEDFHGWPSEKKRIMQIQELCILL